MSNPFIQTRGSVQADAEDRQQLNRLWWERLPMTYADWQAENRGATTAEDFERIEAYTFATSPFFNRDYNFSRQAGSQVLDLGCGSGVFACCFAKAGAQVTAVDLTEAAVDLTRRNAAARGLALNVVRGDAEILALPSDRFDYVFSWGVLHHTNNMKAAFSEVKRVLRPGGRGLVMVYHRHSVVYYVHGLYWLFIKGKIFSGHSLESVQNFYTDGYFHRYLTRRELRDTLEAAGLKPERVFVIQYAKKILPFIPRFFDTWMKARFGMCVVAEFVNPGE